MRLAIVVLIALLVSGYGSPASADSTTIHRENYLQAPPVVQTVQRVEFTVVGVVKFTAFSCYDELCLTSSGTRAGQGSVGAPQTGPAAFPLGTVLEIEGLGTAVVDDRCPGCGDGYWLDYWQPNRIAEVQFGVKWLKVYIRK